MNSAKKVIINNTVALLVLQGANYILPLITLPYLVRVLGANGFGSLIFAQTIIQYIIIITDYGFNYTATRSISLARPDMKKVSVIFSRVIVLKSILGLLCFVLFASFVIASPHMLSEWPLYAVVFLMVPGNILFPTWLFQGLEKMQFITVINALAKFASCVGILLLVRKSSDLILAAALQSISFLIAGIVSIVIALNVIGIKQKIQINRVYFDELRNGGLVFLSTIMGSVYSQGAVLVVSYLLGKSATGYYSLAQKVLSAIVCISLPFSQAIYPHLCTLHQNDSESHSMLLKRIKYASVTAGAFLGVVLYFSAPYICRILIGSSVGDLTTVLKVFALIIPFVLVSILLNPFILSQNLLSSMVILYTVAAMSFVLTSFPLTYKFGILGTSISVLIVEMIICFGSVHITKGPKLARSKVLQSY